MCDKERRVCSISKKIRKNERMPVPFAEGVLNNKDHRYTIDQIICELWKCAQNSMDLSNGKVLRMMDTNKKKTKRNTFRFRKKTEEFSWRDI